VAKVPAATMKALGHVGAPAAPAPVELDPLKILAQYRNPVTGTGYGADVPEAPEEPGLLEAGVRGIKQGVTMGFGDEIEAGVRSAFSDRKYTEIRDEIRAKDKAAQEAHPWGFGLGEVLGGVGSTVATGGLAGAATKLGAKGVAALAGAEGAVSAAGNSEADLTKGDVGGLAKDAAVGAATGATLGYGLHKVFGNYVDTAVERRAQHLTEDLSDGAIPTVKRRLAEVTKVNPKSGESLAVNVLDNDAEFTKALGKGQEEARAVADKRLKDLGGKVTKIYDAMDAETGGIPLGQVVSGMGEMVENADLAGNAQIHGALDEARNQFLASYRRRLDLAPGQSLDDVMIPTQEVRQWVTRLRKQATTSMGSLSETERKVVKDRVHEAADDLLKAHIDSVAREVPTLEPAIEELRAANREILAYSSAADALKNAAKRKSWSPTNLRDLLSSSSLPATAGVIGASADVLTGGAVFAGAKLAQAGAKKANRAATFELSKLVRAARAGDVGKAQVLEALRAGVPTGTVSAILGTVRNLPEEIRALPGNAIDAATD
jgi:hypothetical protein